MSWNNLNLFFKVLFGVGLILLILTVISSWSYINVDKMTDDVKGIINGNELKGEILQREIDHLNWVGSLSKFVNDDSVNKLEIQLDHTQCGLGKWYYGEGRIQTEARYPKHCSVLLASGLRRPHSLTEDRLPDQEQLADLCL